jgi:hypothetical protein
MNTSKPLVYVSTDALLVPSEHPDAVLECGIAEYAKSFMHWCTGHYSTVLLTDLPVAHARYLISRLRLMEDQLPMKFYYGAKTDRLPTGGNFFLIDDALIPGEVSWFLEHGLQDQLIGVDPHTGVSPMTRQTLEERIRHGR